MLKVIVAGTRGFHNYELLVQMLDFFLSDTDDEVEIVSGTCKGADLLGEKYAEEKGYKIKRFSADWDKHGKRAGYLRNAEMADYGDVLVAFWDEKSKGTKHMIDLAMKKGLKVRRVLYFEGTE